MDRLGGSFGSHDAEDHSGYDAGPDHSAPEPPPSPVGQDERRMQVRAYNHWASLLGERNFPDITDLEPEKLDDFGPYSVVLDFTTEVDDPAVQFVGAMLATECDAHEHIRQLSDVPSRSLLSRITDHYMQILANQAPIGFEAEFVNQRGITVLYRGILLPYSSDDATIDFIYGVINWKEMADQQTADELLLEIDQALGAYRGESDNEDTGECPVETAEMLTEQAARDWADEAVLELGNAEMIEDNGAHRLPEPAFGEPADEDAHDGPREFAHDADEDEDEDEDEGGEIAWNLSTTAKAGRGVDALGNPIGGAHPADGEEYAEHGEAGHYDNGMKTAADYGLPEWDDEDEEEDDVEDVVDPLADDGVSTSLTSLVSRGLRHKKAVDLSATTPPPAVPQAYEGEPVTLPALGAQDYEPEAPALAEELEEETADYGEEPVAETVDAYGLETEAAEEYELPADFAEPVAEGAPEPAELVLEAPDPVVEEFTPVADEEYEEIAPAIDEPSPEGLYDCLAAAREMAQTALTTEDRSRKALYSAVGRAYDFSLEAEANPADYEELIADNGLTVQDRAPMTPIVKLVFGADYDKTRLTEYAAVLMHAHRTGVERGSLTTYLRTAEGGLKGILNAERRARKEEQGKPVGDHAGVRSALAKKLRKIEPLSFADVAEEGAEFALVMVRRTPDGDLVVLGEVPEDIPLLEKAARKLLG